MAEMIRPSELSPVAANVNPGSAIIVDDGLIVQKATPLQLMDAARPLASADDAMTLTDNTKLMSPLRVGQAIAGKVVDYSAGNGITKTGNQFALDPTVLVAKADTNQANVAAFEGQERTLSGTYARRPSTPRAITAGIGDHYIDRHYYVARINGKVTDVGGAPPAAPVIGPFGATAYIGGANLDAVAEVGTFTGLYDTASPNCSNANAVGLQARMIGGSPAVQISPGVCQVNGVNGPCEVDGQANGTKMALFAGAFYMGCYPNFKNGSLTGIEIDVGHPFNEPDNAQTRTISGRNALTLLSMGSKKAPEGQDCAINIVSGPQYAGVQGASRAGWRVGIQFASNFAPAGFGEPIAADGSLIRTIGAAPWQIQNAFLLDTCIITGAILKTQNVTWTESVLELKAQTGGIDIGSTTLTGGTNFIDFHNGFNTDYSARISSAGGDGTTGSAGVTVTASQMQMPAKVGFGVGPVPRATLNPPAGATIADVQQLINQIRAALIAVGLAV